MAEPDVGLCDPPGGVGIPLPQVVSPLTSTGVLEHVCSHARTRANTHTCTLHVRTLVSEYSDTREEVVEVRVCS